MAILRAIGLGKDYGATTAVGDLALDITEGEIFGLLGPNGAGKTTTISMLSGVLTPSRGTVLIAGHDLAKEPFAARRALGLVPQDLALYEDLSAHQNLVFFGRIYGLGGQRLQARVDWALTVAGLADRATQVVATFSGGMKRRLNLAAGLMHEPRVLILDEPTVGVDPQSRNYIFETVRALREQHGMTVLYTSHHMDEVQALCERVAIMDHGAIIEEGRVEALLAAHGGELVEIELGSPGLASKARPSGALEAAEAPSPEATVAAAQAAVRDALGAGADVQRAGVTLRFPPCGKLGAAISALERQGVCLRAVRTLEPDLEAVFLARTGKRLRDE